MLVLASQSPRRRELLTQAGFSFVVRAASVPEQRGPNEPPAEYVLRLARQKAEAVLCAPDEVVLGADTVVVVGEQVLEKPLDVSDARRMLETLSGREHWVLTGVCLRSSISVVTDIARTKVRFWPMSNAEIAWYVQSGEPMDKAGGYAIQGLASRFISGIEGCYFNVVGLPVSLIYRLMTGTG